MVVFFLAIAALLITLGFQYANRIFLLGVDLSMTYFACMPIGLFLVLYALFGRRSGTNQGSIDKKAPDLAGRWVGFLTSSYQRDGQNVVVPITLEIVQNASSVFIRACFEKATSDSMIANFKIAGGRVYLCYLYDNSVNKSGNREMTKDKGAVILEYLEGDNRMLKGNYFNDVRPKSNFGEIKVIYSGPELLNT